MQKIPHAGDCLTYILLCHDQFCELAGVTEISQFSSSSCVS